MTERCIGIEVTPSKIKLLEMASTEPPKVCNFSIVDLLSPHPKNILQQIISIVSNMDLRTKRARITINASGTHRIINLPALAKKEINTIIERELKEVLTAPIQEMSFNWQIIGENEEGKKTVLAIAAPLSSVREQVAFLENIGFQPNLITTVPFALYNYLKLSRELKLYTTALVYFEELKVYIIFVRKGLWLFHREFSYSPDKLESVLPEISRSFLYHRHQCKGEEVEKVFISGETNERIEKGFLEVLNVKVERFSPDLDLLPLKGRAEEFNKVSSKFTALIGLTATKANDCINLAISEIREKTRAAFINKAVMAGIVILAIIIGRGYVNLGNDISYYKKTLLEKQGELARLEPCSAAQNERNVYTNNLYLLWNTGNYAGWTEALRELSILIPPEIVFHNLSFKRNEGKIIVNIKGEAVTAQDAGGLKIFNGFYSKLSASPYFTGMKVNTDSLKFTKSSEVEKDTNIHLAFEINGELAPLFVEYE